MKNYNNKIFEVNIENLEFDSDKRLVQNTIKVLEKINKKDKFFVFLKTENCSELSDFFETEAIIDLNGMLENFTIATFEEIEEWLIKEQQFNFYLIEENNFIKKQFKIKFGNYKNNSNYLDYCKCKSLILIPYK